MPERERVEGLDDRRGFDRVNAPDPTRLRRGELQGKRALFSVDVEANPTAAVLVSCGRCAVELGMTTREAAGLFKPPFVANPVSRKLWTRCPSCDRWSWLRLRLGPGIPWPFPG